MALLAFGKMASKEMTAASDLDFILLYDAPPAGEESDGARPLATSQYFARLTQRLVAAITAPTSEGVLYQADMRLRPSGNAGPLATSLRAFRIYQAESALDVGAPRPDPRPGRGRRWRAGAACRGGHRRRIVAAARRRKKSSPTCSTCGR